MHRAGNVQLPHMGTTPPPHEPTWQVHRFPTPVDEPAAPSDVDPFDVPNCPKCLEPMEPHETFPTWWCESCGVALSTP